MPKTLFSIILCLPIFFSTNAIAKTVVKMYLTSSANKVAIGTVAAEDSPYGLLIVPNLNHLSPGAHGFHVHKHPSCGKHAKAAGGHFDPQQTNKHLGPYNKDGHLGDMPILLVNKDGKANLPLLAPRLTEADLKGHTIMIHSGGDNYSDKPAALGGGGARFACGVVK